MNGAKILAKWINSAIYLSKKDAIDSIFF